MPKTLLSFVIPCYRSAGTIGAVVREIADTVATRADEYDHEIVLVNDGSPDTVANVIAGLCKTYPQIVFINLSRNFGQHSAIMAGFAQARGGIIICLDDDGQTPANECFKLIDKVAEGYDIVYAEYEKREQNALRNVGSRFNAACNHFFFNQPKKLKVNSYFACQRFVVDSALQYPNPFPYVTGLLFQSVSRYCNVPVTHRARLEGKSGYSLKKLISLWTNGVTAFSIKPLRFANYIGWLTAVFGFLFALYTVVRKLVNPNVEAGWSSTIAVLLVLGGVIIALIGVVGEYVGRIYLSINRCPQYVVRNVIDRRGPETETARVAEMPDAGAPGGENP
ncbi:MAG TPA: glycosyltransferase family 2 protein [Candidatus Limiplasma sp.]|nr:glycosyltransferase family 2 protein [Candidatus Limiplasma sp.]HPS81103.1 glycosyltransferase family 2 protein [Candidatus Limiplasma sp.]